MDGLTEASGSTLNRLDSKLVILSKIDKLRNNTRSRKVQELISLDEGGAQTANRRKAQGLTPIGEDKLVETALTNLLGWSRIWREIRTLDIDRNGFIERQEFEQLLRDQYPLELEKYSFLDFLDKYPCSYDDNLINYLPIKNALNARISKILQEQRE